MDKYFPIEDQIEIMATTLRGRVVLPHHGDYDDLRSVSLANFDCRPKAVVRVANATDVAAVLNFARATDLELAVRGGGHSVGGFSGSEGGLVIDLRDINALEIDRGAMTAWAGAGLTAGEVTRTLEQMGLIVGFGDASSVGIAGLTLGGGIGYLVRKYGLTIDNLLAAEVVTAMGDIVVADADNHPDLFWALRGGGGNFGVVTRFKYRLQPLPEFTGGPLIMPATAEVLAGIAAAADAAPDELSAIVNVMPLPPLPFLPAHLHGTTVIMAMMAFAGAPDAAAAALAPFRALATPIADLVGPAPMSSLYVPDERVVLSIGTLFMDRLTVAEAQRMLDLYERCDSPMKVAQIRVLGGAFSRVPVEATAFAHRRSGIMGAFLAMYPDAADSPRHDAWVRDSAAAMRQENGGAYVNFLSASGADALSAAYPGATGDRLRRIKRRYDPENLFRRNHNLKPAA